jgi:hypothetical protein
VRDVSPIDEIADVDATPELAASSTHDGRSLQQFENFPGAMQSITPVLACLTAQVDVHIIRNTLARYARWYTSCRDQLINIVPFVMNDNGQHVLCQFLQQMYQSACLVKAFLIVLKDSMCCVPHPTVCPSRGITVKHAAQTPLEHPNTATLAPC